MRADKLRNRTKIVEKAKELLERGNVDTISLEEIAEAAEVTRATLYNHFPAREDLLKEMVIPALHSITDELSIGNNRENADFSLISTALFHLYCEYREILELVSCQTLYGDEDVTAAHGCFMEQFKEAMVSAGAETFPLGMDLSLRLLSASYLPILRELRREDRLEQPLFHRILQGVLLL
ncbi:MAG: TetR/AcrR family transcriptional regulator [Spirochaetales bacterium]|nr:TetR/AcrR family transcriptional regulator [Spirochaetales bacterium]